VDKEPDWESYNVNLKYLFETNVYQRARMEELAHYTYGFVLDVGAHDGYVSYLIKGQKKEVITTDISKASCRRAKTFGLDVLVCDVRHLPFRDAVFDCVVGGELLEHLPNMGYALAEMQRVSKKRVIISVPHEFWKGDPTHRWDIMWRGIGYKGQKLNFDPNLGFTILIMDKKGGK
jgi:ubiquinone/menaquinone biosynthesis C-methylase UbiE